jgi:threonine/homoserine/homoserine lactone efflux protein
MKAAAQSRVVALLFVGGFFGCLVGSKVFLAVLAGRSKHLLSDRTYRAVMRVLGMLLLVFAWLLFTDGFRMIAGRGG